MKIISLLTILTITGCAAAPTTGITPLSSLDGSSTFSAKELESSLKRGDNFLSEGFSADALLLTDAYITQTEKEAGIKNMDSEVVVHKKINDALLLIKDKTCFSINVDTYSLEQASFKNWVFKLKDFNGQILDIDILNVSGVSSVPKPYQDMQGRTWHNNTYACLPKQSLIEKGFSLYLIPQWETNTKNAKTELIWQFK